MLIHSAGEPKKTKQTKKYNKPICCLDKKQTKIEIRYLQQQKTQKTKYIQKVPIKAP